MDTFDRIGRIVRSEISSHKSQSRHDSNQQARELEEQAVSLRQQIANLEAMNQDSMSSALRQEYAALISNLKRSLAPLEQAILDLNGTVDSRSVGVDNSELEATKINFGTSQNSIKTHPPSVAAIDAELEALKQSLDEL
jgi:phage host-nuclease inhibitor protein Gam